MMPVLALDTLHSAITVNFKLDLMAWDITRMHYRSITQEYEIMEQVHVDYRMLSEISSSFIYFVYKCHSHSDDRFWIPVRTCFHEIFIVRYDNRAATGERMPNTGRKRLSTSRIVRRPSTVVVFSISTFACKWNPER